LAQGHFVLADTKDGRERAYSISTFASDHALLRFALHQGDWTMDFAPRPMPGETPKWIPAGLRDK
jgi:hypothetical protein